MLNFLLSLLGTYALICFGAWVLHRYFLYMPDKKRYAPSEVGLADVEEITLEGKGGVKLIAWYQPAGAASQRFFISPAIAVRPPIARARSRRSRQAVMAYSCSTIAAIGGSGGWPTEANNIADAVAAYQYLQEELGVSPRNIVAYGELLGTGVATRLALLRQVKALVLEAPFTSVVDVGRQVWRFLPLRLVMTDQYRTIDRIGSVKVPLLIVHGAREAMIPVRKQGQFMPRRTSQRRSPSCAAGTTTICSITAPGPRSRRSSTRARRSASRGRPPGLRRAGGLAS